MKFWKRRDKIAKPSKKRKLLRGVGILAALFVLYLVAVFIFVVFDSWHKVHREANTQPGSPSSIKLASNIAVDNINLQELWVGTNAQRAKAGLNPVVLDNRLNESAHTKCTDMVTRNYWSHDTPDGATWYSVIQNQAIKYTKAGENLAYGQSNASSVMKQWMNSLEHKENILNPAYTNVGFAVCKGDNFLGKGPQLITIQHFIRP